jgi:hypothetical protein
MLTDISAQQFASKDLISNFLFSLLVAVVHITFRNFGGLGLWVSLDASFSEINVLELNDVHNLLSSIFLN